MNIRPAVVADALAIATAHVRSWQSAYAHLLPADYLSGLSIEQRTPLWAAILSKADSEVCVAEENAQVQAFVRFGPCRDEPAPAGRGEIWALYALPDAWGTGMGRGLLCHALERLQQQGLRETSLWVLAGNERGLRFYRAGGFAAVPGSDKTLALGGAQVQEVQLLRRHAA
jgi:ribosomal protein S18 acetylase RimI-like enzyme